MTRALTVTQPDSLAALAANVEQALSIASPDLALRRPLGALVQAALDAACESEHTRRSYAVAIALFIHFLDGERGSLIPDELWRPLVQKRAGGEDLLPVTAPTGRKKAEYVYNDAALAAILRLVDAALLDGFRLWRRAEGDTHSTAGIRVYAVRTFLSVALRDHVLTPDQAANLGLRPYRKREHRDVKPVGRRLSKAEVRALRDAVTRAHTATKGTRDLSILDLALYLGLREAEIADVKMSDFQKDGGRWWLVLTGKGQKTRRLKLHDVAYKSLAAWFEVAGLVWHDERPVFYSVTKGGSVKGNKITPTDVSRTVAHYGALAEISEARGAGRLGAHDLRRTCARNAHDNGAPLLLIQRMLGHANPDTTARYIGLGDDDQESATDFVRY